MTELTERVAKLETELKHVATKADISELKGSFKTLLLGIGSVLALLNIALRFWPS